MIKILLKHMKPYKGKLWLMVILNALGGICTMGLPYIMSNIVNIGIEQGNMEYIFVQGGIMLALALVLLTSHLLNNLLASQVTALFSSNTRKKVVDKINSLTSEQFSEIGTGSLITRSTEDVDWIEESLIMLPYVLINVPVMFIGGFLLTAIVDWTLAFIILATVPIVVALVAVLMRGMGERWNVADKLIDDQNRIVRERLSGIRVIRAFDKDQEEHQRAVTATRKMTKKFVVNNSLSGIISPIVMFLLNIATVLVIYIGADRIQQVDMIQGGDIIAVLQYMALMVNAVLMLSWTLALLPHVKVGLLRIQEVLDIPVVVEEEKPTKQLDGSITMENVSFAYPHSNANVISDMSIDVNSGETIGIIGGTGSGKSTLIKILLAFYNTYQGTMKIGKEDYIDIGSRCVRDNMAVALQKSMIFEGTVRDNITIGNDHATAEEIDKVVKVAQLGDFVKSHKEGLDYVVTQGGNNISGGQKQRINIARTILRQASVYIFDDSFSALDYLTESKLRKQLNKFLDGKTQIIVTQRAATAMRCDRVYVLDKGSIIGSGTHKQLLRSCPLYKEICDSQLGGESHE